jgi:TatD DNase family protein
MIDTHAHLNLMHAPLNDVLSNASAAGVTHIVQVGIDFNSISENVATYASYPMCSVTGGIHPLSVDSTELSEVLPELTRYVNDLVAIGEIGLDYKYGDQNKVRQHTFLRAQLEFALTWNKPVIIHSRHADADMLSIVNDFPTLKKVFHCYATTIDFYHQLTGNANYVSFTGLVTYSKKGKVIQALKQVPMDRIMIETDAPYLLPKGVDAHQNSPEYVGHVANAIAQHRQVSVDEVILRTTQNAVSFFNLDTSIF